MFDAAELQRKNICYFIIGFPYQFNLVTISKPKVCSVNLLDSSIKLVVQFGSFNCRFKLLHVNYLTFFNHSIFNVYFCVYTTFFSLTFFQINFPYIMVYVLRHHFNCIKSFNFNQRHIIKS